MDTNKDNVAVSSLYTAAVWNWAKLRYAEVCTPPGSLGVFRAVNGYMRIYRWINPRFCDLRYQLLHRHQSINCLLENNPTSKVIEIASGFSPRGAWFSRNRPVQYFEVDLPDVVEYKRRHLSRSELGLAILKRPNFHLQAGDVMALRLDQWGPAVSTAIVSEGLMMYFSRDQQLTIWADIAKYINSVGGYYLFDYIPLSDEPSRSRVGQWLHNLRMKFPKLQGDFKYDSRTAEGIAADLKAVGFQVVEVHSTSRLKRIFGLAGLDRPSNTLIFACSAQELQC